MLVLFAYLDDGVGTQGVNYVRIVQIAKVIRLLNIPWVLLGDFNLTPTEFTAAGWHLILDGSVRTPVDVVATCSAGQGRLIDFMLLGAGAEHLVGNLRAWRGTPWAPHVGLIADVQRNPLSLTGVVCLRPPAILPPRLRKLKAVDLPEPVHPMDTPDVISAFQRGSDGFSRDLRLARGGPPQRNTATTSETDADKLTAAEQLGRDYAGWSACAAAELTCGLRGEDRLSEGSGARLELNPSLVAQRCGGEPPKIRKISRFRSLTRVWLLNSELRQEALAPTPRAPLRTAPAGGWSNCGRSTSSASARTRSIGTPPPRTPPPPCGRPPWPR